MNPMYTNHTRQYRSIKGKKGQKMENKKSSEELQKEIIYLKNQVENLNKQVQLAQFALMMWTLMLGGIIGYLMR